MKDPIRTWMPGVQGSRGTRSAYQTPATQYEAVPHYNEFVIACANFVGCGQYTSDDVELGPEEWERCEFEMLLIGDEEAAVADLAGPTSNRTPEGYGIYTFDCHSLHDLVSDLINSDSVGGRKLVRNLLHQMGLRPRAT